MTARRPDLRGAVALLAAAALAACATPSPKAPPPPPTAAEAAAPPHAESAWGACAGALTPDDQWVECVLSHLTLRQKAAQMVMARAFGDYGARSAASWRPVTRQVTRDEVGGIIMSVGSPLEIASKLNELQGMSDLPLLVGADLETGAGFRARGGWFLPNAIDLGGAVNFPPSMALGATGDTMLAYAEAQVTAKEGRALGIHIDFAPVLDVNNNPANPVISTRSFGGDPAAVARFGTAYIRGLQDGGMVATGKHFPGHGDTGTNSHLALPVVNASRARLDSVELVPFRAAVGAGVGAIMTFHGSMPALDSSGVPGTLSAAVLTGMLRDSMHFSGLVVTDAMDMRGVLDTYGSAEAIMRAVSAGADMLLQPVDATEAIDAVTAGVVMGRYTEARLDRSVRGILRVKLRLGLRHKRMVDIENVRNVVGDSAHEALARRIAERSIVVLRDSAQQFPLAKLNRGARVLSITYAQRPDLGAGVTLECGAQAVVHRSSFGVRGLGRSRAELLAAAGVVGFSAGDPHWLVCGAELEGGEHQCAAAVRFVRAGAREARPASGGARHGKSVPAAADPGCSGLCGGVERKPLLAVRRGARRTRLGARERTVAGGDPAARADRRGDGSERAAVVAERTAEVTGRIDC